MGVRKNRIEMLGGFRQRGLTLIELMVGVAVLSILVSMAVPSFNSLMRKQEFKSQLGLIRSTLAFVRTEAITRKTNIAMCGSSDGVSCVGSKDWSGGWIVFVDSDDDGEFDTGEDILRTGGDAGGKSKIDVVTASAKAIRYQASGESGDGVSALCLSADSALSGSVSDNSRTFHISKVGSFRVARGTICP